jgi:hypothetical protein
MTAPADKGKKAKTDADAGEENEQIDGALVLSIEKLQEIQDELEKVRSEPILPRSRLFLGLLSLLLPAWWVVGARCCRIWQWGLGRSVGLSRIWEESQRLWYGKILPERSGDEHGRLACAIQ